MCHTPGLALKHLQMCFALFLSLCAGLFQMGHVRQMAEPPWVPGSHIEADQAANGKHILNLT